MNYTVSIMQPLTIKQQADEIAVLYKSINLLYDIPEELKDKKYIVHIDKDAEVDWDALRGLAALLNLTVCLADASQSETALAHNLKWYWAYPCETFFTLQGLIDAKASEVLINGPLFFNLPSIKKLCDKHEIKIRAIANQADLGSIQHVDGICGSYIRPEDISIYEPYIDTIEFLSKTLAQEVIIFNIYKVEKRWLGNLNILINHLNYNVDNRGFDNTFATNRLNCKQRCLLDKCNLCRNTFRFINLVDKEKNNNG